MYCRPQPKFRGLMGFATFQKSSIASPGGLTLEMEGGVFLCAIILSARAFTSDQEKVFILGGQGWSCGLGFACWAVGAGSWASLSWAGGLLPAPSPWGSPPSPCRPLGLLLPWPSPRRLSSPLPARQGKRQEGGKGAQHNVHSYEHGIPHGKIKEKEKGNPFILQNPWFVLAFTLDPPTRKRTLSRGGGYFGGFQESALMLMTHPWDSQGVLASCREATLTIPRSEGFAQAILPQWLSAKN